MSKVTIVTNNVPRHVVNGFELSEAERKAFDYYKNAEDLDCASFVRYRGAIYDLGEFTEAPEDLKPWHGIHSDSYFSGILFRYADNHAESVIVGRYYS